MKQIFINLPVKNITKSMDFYARLGFSNKPLFSDNQQKCMVWSEEIYVMLIVQEKFKSYSKKPIPNTKDGLATYFTLPVESLESVNQIVERGLRAGGTEEIPMIDEGFMQIRRLSDFDGHTWHFIFMDLTKFKNQ